MFHMLLVSSILAIFGLAWLRYQLTASGENEERESKREERLTGNAGSDIVRIHSVTR